MALRTSSCALPCSRYLSPFKAEWDPKDLTETLFVIGRYIRCEKGQAVHMRMCEGMLACNRRLKISTDATDAQVKAHTCACASL